MLFAPPREAAPQEPPVELPPELPLMERWDGAFRLAQAWFMASGKLRAAFDFEGADRYLQHGLDILDALETSYEQQTGGTHER